MAASTPFDSWMRKTADAFEGARETVSALSGAIDPKEVESYAQDQTARIHRNYADKARGLADVVLPGAYNAVGSFLQEKGKELSSSPIPQMRSAGAGVARAGAIVNPPRPTGEPVAKPQPNMAKATETLTQGGYLPAFQRARSVDESTSKFLDERGALKVDEYAKASGIDVNPTTRQGQINRAILSDPRYLNQTRQAMSMAGQAAWNWAKSNPLLVAGGLGLAGVLAAGAFGGGGRSDDDDDAERPVRPMNWAATRYWRRQ